VILVIAGVEHPHFFIRSFAPMSDWKRFSSQYREMHDENHAR